ncbi:TIGR01777 family oxidoreductase [Pseudactinotalea sp. Z1732]|uniref:TIGR01777 family oxidoreductase n=1 Tax=Micrococcales TaxID=85006 RepID=UPI003C7CB119
MSVTVLAGASGFLGSALAHALTEQRHTIRQLVRRPARGPDEVQWDPDAGVLPQAALEDASAVVNLGGAGMGDRRWNARYRRLIITSRVHGTALLANALAERARGGERIRFLQASAVGYYGDGGEQELTEDSPNGEGFVPSVCQAWEAAADPAVRAGVPVAFLRTGLVLDPAAGALARMMPLLRLGLAGPLGSGRQWWAWITRADHVRAMVHLLGSGVTGPVNVSAPTPERNKNVTTTLARQLGRPAFVPAPAFGIRLVLGEFAREITASQRMVPRVLVDDGFTFTAPTIALAAEQLLG